jgi:hypothetical protein
MQSLAPDRQVGAEAGTCRIRRGGTFGASRSCEMLRSVYRQKMPLSCLDLTVREAHLGQWSQDPKTGRTYERKRSEHAARANLASRGPSTYEPSRFASRPFRLRSLAQRLRSSSPGALGKGARLRRSLSLPLSRVLLLTGLVAALGPACPFGSLCSRSPGAI